MSANMIAMFLSASFYYPQTDTLVVLFGNVATGGGALHSACGGRKGSGCREKGLH